MSEKANNADSSKSSSSSKTASEFLCKPKYLNTLPDLPFDPKLLSYPFDPLRFIKYTTTSLERTYKHILHTEPDLGIPIDLIDPSSYKIVKRPETRPLHPLDEQLIGDMDAIEAKASTTPKRRETVRPSVFWLQKTKYMTGDADLPKFKSDNIESTTGWGKRHDAKEKEMKREDQLKAIQGTFEQMQHPPVHPTNPALKPVEVLPVLPNFDSWASTYSQVLFDTDPVSSVSHDTLTEQERKELKSEAIIKGFAAEGSRSFIAYMVPKKRKRDASQDGSSENNNSNASSGNGSGSNSNSNSNGGVEGGQQQTEYDWVREYTYDMKTGKDFADTYFFTLAPDAIYYNEIGTRVTLMKFKDASGAFVQPSKIIANHRPLNDEEIKQREERKKTLTNPENKRETEGGANDEEIKDEEEEDTSVWKPDEDDE